MHALFPELIFRFRKQRFSLHRILNSRAFPVWNLRRSLSLSLFIYLHLPFIGKVFPFIYSPKWIFQADIYQNNQRRKNHATHQVLDISLNVFRRWISAPNFCHVTLAMFRQLRCLSADWLLIERGTKVPKMPNDMQHLAHEISLSFDASGNMDQLIKAASTVLFIEIASKHQSIYTALKSFAFDVMSL